MNTSKFNHVKTQLCALHGAEAHSCDLFEDSVCVDIYRFRGPHALPHHTTHHKERLRQAEGMSEHGFAAVLEDDLANVAKRLVRQPIAGVSAVAGVDNGRREPVDGHVES